MKVLFVVSTNSLMGGGSAVFQSVIPLMRDEGIEPWVFIRNDGEGLVDKFVEMGIPAELTNFRWWCHLQGEHGIGAHIHRVARLALNAHANRQLGRRCKELGAACIVVFDGVIGLGYDAAQRAGVPSVGYLQEALDEGLGMEMDSATLVRRNFSSATRLLAISGYVRAWWTPYAGVTPIEVVPDGFDRRRAWLGERTWCTDGVVRMALLGDMENPAKGHLLVVEAVALLAEQGGCDFEVNLYGAALDSAHMSASEQAIRERVRDTRLTDVVRIYPYRRDVASVWRTTDVVLSACGSEGFGLSVLEGMASGCLAVGPDAGGVYDLIQGSRGIAYRNGDALDLARALGEAIQLMRADPCAAVRSSREYARSLTVEQQARSLAEVIRRSVAGASHGVGEHE